MKTDSGKNLRDRLATGKSLFGTFLKSPGVHALEIVADTGLDFVVIDAEHAPWDRNAIDLAILAARSVQIDVLVRVSGVTEIANALDCGATGIMVPHVLSAGIAREIVDASHYRTGRRGFSNSTRAGGYGRLPMAEHMDTGDQRTTVIAMLEDPQALGEIEAIVNMEGIDAFFLGRGDLAAALRERSSDAAAVRSAIADLARAVKLTGRPLVAYIGKAEEIADLRTLGVTAFIISSDQGLLRTAAAAELARCRRATGCEGA